MLGTEIAAAQVLSRHVAVHSTASSLETALPFIIMMLSSLLISLHAVRSMLEDSIMGKKASYSRMSAPTLLRYKLQSWAADASTTAANPTQAEGDKINTSMAAFRAEVDDMKTRLDAKIGPGSVVVTNLQKAVLETVIEQRPAPEALPVRHERRHPVRRAEWNSTLTALNLESKLLKADRPALMRLKRPCLGDEATEAAPIRKKGIEEQSGCSAKVAIRAPDPPRLAAAADPDADEMPSLELPDLIEDFCLDDEEDQSYASETFSSATVDGVELSTTDEVKTIVEEVLSTSQDQTPRMPPVLHLDALLPLAELQMESSTEAPSDDDVLADVGSKSCGCSTGSGWGCTTHRVYSAHLLLHHHVVSKRIACGPPGLTRDEPSTESSAGLRAVSSDVVAAAFAPPGLVPPALRKAESQSEGAVQTVFTLKELANMAPPTSKRKLLIAESPGAAIYVNSAHHRYQLYQDGNEIKSLSWGGLKMNRLSEAWGQLPDFIPKQA